MTPEQVAELGWDTMLPLSLDEALNALEAVTQFRAFADLGVEFLTMYIAFKRLEANQASDKTEEERRDLLSKIF
jgi:glutamine synthetase